MVHVRLTREVKLPPELTAAASTGRHELAGTLKRKLNQKEQAAVVDALAVYIDTTWKMKEQIEYLTGLVVTLRSAILEARGSVQSANDRLFLVSKMEREAMKKFHELQEVCG